MTEHGDLARLQSLLGGPDIEWLVARVRARIGAAAGGKLSGTVVLHDPTGAQRTAAMRLVGTPNRAGSTTLRVDLALVEGILRRGPWPEGLANAIEMLTGPVVDRTAERLEQAAAWDAAAALLAPVIDRYPHIKDWWLSWCAAGKLKRAAQTEASRTGGGAAPDGAADLVNSVVTVFSRIPAEGIPLAVLARSTTGDAHGLDSTRPLGRLAVAVLRAALSPDADDEPSGRAVWDTAGVVMSGLTSTVLSLGVAGVIPPTLTHPLAEATSRALETMRAARAPGILTLDQVRSGGVGVLPADAVIYVCENPTVVEIMAARWAAADRALDTPVLVCTSGQPSTAVVELLLRLTQSGAAVRYHGDFDWAGLRIARALAARVPWTPWRFDSEDYMKAADEAMSLRLTGTPAESPWDPALAVIMAERGLAIEEEAVGHLLAADLIG